MRFAPKTLVALAAGFVAVEAHMVMLEPPPMGADSLNNSPLAADGSDYPCKQRSGVYAAGENTPMPLGSTQELAFKGSAVHGGGSCQVSITYDKEPTKDSVFKVIHSIVGGCPAAAEGNLPSDPNGGGASKYNFQIPSDLPTGEATLAWTWFNRIGNREMYMNCARVTITGGASSKLRRREGRPVLRRDQSAFNGLPNMFKANIGNGCTTLESKDLEFPEPGASVEQGGSGQTAPPTGSCAAGGGSSTGGSTSGNAGSTPSNGGSPSPSPSPSGSTQSGNGNGIPNDGLYRPSSSASASVPANTGGVFNEAESAPATPSATASPAPAPAPQQEQEGAGEQANATGGQTGPCTVEGAFLCLAGGKAFQQCGSGRWSTVMQMAAGTTCAPQAGSIRVAAVKQKRSLRFSHGHLRHRQESA